jgi:glutathione S-transferase
VGDAPTLADVFLVPQVYNANRFGVEVSAFPKVVEIATRASALAAFVAGHPDRQPDTPKAKP